VVVGKGDAVVTVVCRFVSVMDINVFLVLLGGMVAHGVAHGRDRLPL
jgi:hypothetical protein